MVISCRETFSTSFHVFAIDVFHNLKTTIRLCVYLCSLIFFSVFILEENPQKTTDQVKNIRGRLQYDWFKNTSQWKFSRVIGLRCDSVPLQLRFIIPVPSIYPCKRAGKLQPRIFTIRGQPDQILLPPYIFLLSKHLLSIHHFKSTPECWVHNQVRILNREVKAVPWKNFSHSIWIQVSLSPWMSSWIR